MVRESHITFLGIRFGRFLFLFISIILMMVPRPVMGGFIRLTILTDILFSAILISSLWAVSQNRRVFLLALSMAIPALVLGWVPYLAELPFLRILSRVFLGIFFGVMLVSLLSHIRRAKEVTADLIMGAASTYFLLRSPDSSTLLSLSPDSWDCISPNRPRGKNREWIAFHEKKRGSSIWPPAKHENPPSAPL